MNDEFLGGNKAPSTRDIDSHDVIGPFTTSLAYGAASFSNCLLYRAERACMFFEFLYARAIIHFHDPRARGSIFPSNQHQTLSPSSWICVYFLGSGLSGR